MVTLNNPTVTEGHGYVWDGVNWIKQLGGSSGLSFTSVEGSVIAYMNVLKNGSWQGLVSDSNGNLMVNATAQGAHGLPVIEE